MRHKIVDAYLAGALDAARALGAFLLSKDITAAEIAQFMAAGALRGRAERYALKQSSDSVTDIRSEDEMSEWQPIETAPKADIAAVLFFSGRTWTDQNDQPCSLGLVRDHSERCEIAFYEAGTWYFAGTGHEVYEDWRVEGGPNYTPTHWMPLPAPPPAGEG